MNFYRKPRIAKLDPVPALPEIDDSTSGKVAPCQTEATGEIGITLTGKKFSTLIGEKFSAILEQLQRLRASPRFCRPMFSPRTRSAIFRAASRRRARGFAIVRSALPN